MMSCSAPKPPPTLQYQEEPKAPGHSHGQGLGATAPQSQASAIAFDRVEGHLSYLNVEQGGPEILARLDPYLNARSASFEDANDSGHVLVLTRFADVNQVHEVAGPLGMRRQLTFGADPVSTPKYVEHNDVVYLKDNGGDENYQVYLLDRHTQTTTRLTDGVSRHVGLVVSEDKKKLAYVSNKIDGTNMDVYLYDLDRKQESLILKVEGSYEPLEFSKDGKMLLIQEEVSISDMRISTLNCETKTKIELSLCDGPASNREAHFGRNSEEVWYTSDCGSDVVKVGVINTRTSVKRGLTHAPQADVEKLLVLDRKIAYVTNEGGSSVLHIADPTRGTELVPPELGMGTMTSWGKGPGGSLYYSWASFMKPTDVFQMHLPSKRVDKYTESEMGGISASTEVEGSLIHFNSFDAEKISAFLIKPKGATNLPVLISIHGGPEAQSRPMFSPLLQYLVREEKLAVILPNVRGSDGYGKRFLSLDNGIKREDAVKDIGELLKWIHTEGGGGVHGLDASRLAVIGGSYGGYMTLSSVMHFGTQLKAAIDIVGISNFVTFLENTSEYRRDLRRVEYGDERDPDMRAFLERISPLSRINTTPTPLFLVHGKNDPRVPLSEADQIIRSLMAEGKAPWYLVADNEGHGFYHKENRDALNLATVLFLREHLFQ